MMNNLLTHLKKVNPESLYPNFTFCDFIVLHETESFFIDIETFKIIQINKELDFFHNSICEYNGSIIAVIDLNSLLNKSIEDITAIVIHEMFHVFQLKSDCNLMPNEILGINYPTYITNTAHKLNERKLLIEYLKQNDISFLKKYLDHQFTRSPIIHDYLPYEYNIESIEGSALYIEYQVKKLLDNNVDIINDIIVTLQHPNLQLRTYHMYTGLVLSIILDNIDPSWKTSYKFKNITLNDYVKQILQYEGQLTDIPDGDILIAKSLTIKNQNIIKNKIQDFLMLDTVKIEGNITITKFDPLHTYRYNEYLFHENGINYTLNNEEFNIKDPALTNINSSLFEATELITIKNK